MEEMFDLGKDAETFATAICTALILNGGKAIAVKIKGEKKQITVADVEKCIDEDGKLDVEKLVGETSILQKLKNKIKPDKSQTTSDELGTTNNGINLNKFNTADIDFTEWSNSRNAFIKYFEKNKNIFLDNGYTIEDIETFCNQVCLCSDKEYMNYIKSLFRKKQ